MDNMKIYNGHRAVPQEALKPITAGRLKGMSDINPMFRIKSLTEDFGVCGIGWYYTVDKQWIEPCGNESVAFVNISLYIKVDGEWSKPIFGTGGSKIISMERSGAYVSDECVDGDCEVLTRNGWVKFKDYNGIDEIAQFDKDTSEITFTKPIRFIKKNSCNTYKKGNIVMTYGHRNLYEDSRGVRKVDIAENLCGYEGRSYFDLHSGIYGKPIELTPMQRVGIMLCCDGTKHSIDSNGNIVWNIAFSKKRKIERCKKLLEEAGIDVAWEHSTKRDNPNWNDYTQIRFKLDNTDYKTYSNFLPYANYNNLFEELVFWDGNYSQYKKNGDASYFSVNYDNIAHIQTLLMMANQYSTIYSKESEKENGNIVYTLYNHKNKRTKITPINKCGEATDVYCVEVPTTFFMIRKNDEILVTGNCYKMATTDAISVACKQLGYAADVYWSKDRTKYNLHDNADTQNEQNQSYQNSNPKKSAPNPQNEAVANQQMIDRVDRNLIPEANAKVTQAQLDTIKSEMQRTGINMHTILTFAKAKSLEEINQATAVAIINNFAKTPNAGERK